MVAPTCPVSLKSYCAFLVSKFKTAFQTCYFSIQIFNPVIKTWSSSTQIWYPSIPISNSWIKRLVWQVRYAIWLLKHPWFQFKTKFLQFNCALSLFKRTILRFKYVFSASQTSSGLIQTYHCASQISSLEIQNSQFRRKKCYPSIPICNSSQQIYNSSIVMHYSTIQTGFCPHNWNLQSFILKQLFCNSNALLFNSNGQ